MTNTANTTPVAPQDSASHLKNVFEQSLAVLSEQDPPGTTTSTPKKVDPRKIKIRLRPRSLPLHMDAVNLQKRAIDNAAKALATLWNISVPGRVKPRTAV